MGRVPATQDDALAAVYGAMIESLDDLRGSKNRDDVISRANLACAFIKYIALFKHGFDGEVDLEVEEV